MGESKKPGTGQMTINCRSKSRLMNKCVVRCTLVLNNTVSIDMFLEFLSPDTFKMFKELIILLETPVTYGI